MRNHLANAAYGILDYAASHDFILVSTDSDFERLLIQVPDAKVVILRSGDPAASTSAPLPSGPML